MLQSPAVLLSHLAYPRTVDRSILMLENIQRHGKVPQHAYFLLGPLEHRAIRLDLMYLQIYRSALLRKSVRKLSRTQQHFDCEASFIRPVGSGTCQPNSLTHLLSPTSFQPYEVQFPGISITVEPFT